MPSRKVFRLPVLPVIKTSLSFHRVSCLRLPIILLVVFQTADVHMYSVSQEDPDSDSTIRVRILLGHTVQKLYGNAMAQKTADMYISLELIFP